MRRFGRLVTMSATAAVLPAACFRGEFLDNTCEQLAGCGEVTSGSTSTIGASTTAVTPTTTSASTSGSTGEGSGGESTGEQRVELVGAVAFRIDSLRIADPDIFAPLLGGALCNNVRNDLSNVINAEVAGGDTNIMLLTQQYDPDAAQINYLLYQKPVCDVALGECTLTDEQPLMFPVFNVDNGNCATYDTTVMKQANVPGLNIPDSPCFRTPEGSLPLKISDSLGYINLIRGQMSSSYDPDDVNPSNGLGDSVLVGFIRKEEAEQINYAFNDMEINLWSVIAGSDHPAECATENGEPSDVDMLDLGGPMGEPDGIPDTVGVWMFFNFTAERVRVFAPV